MKQKLPTRRMRERPDLDQLKRRAKKLLQEFVAGNAGTASKNTTALRTSSRVGLPGD